MLYWSAIILGLLGSLHCLGMCGPIALAVPLAGHGKGSRVGSALTYNFGRISVYAIYGGLFGLLGQGIALAGFQQVVSVVVGLLIISSILVPWVARKSKLLQTPVLLQVGKVKKAFQSLMSQRSYPAIFGIGMLNGLLPCGLIYMALAGTVVASSWQIGTIYMMAFGLGTLPMMLVLPIFRHQLKPQWRFRLSKLIPVAAVIFGLMLILRGSNLGIPFLSPILELSPSAFITQCGF